MNENSNLKTNEEKEIKEKLIKKVTRTEKKKIRSNMIEEIINMDLSELKG